MIDVPVAYPDWLNMTLDANGAVIRLCRRADVLPMAEALDDIAAEWLEAPWDWPPRYAPPKWSYDPILVERRG